MMTLLPSLLLQLSSSPCLETPLIVAHFPLQILSCSFPLYYPYPILLRSPLFPWLLQLLEVIYLYLSTQSQESQMRENMQLWLSESGLPYLIRSFLVPSIYLQVSRFLFFLMAGQHSTVCMCHISIVHLSAEGHLGCFHFLAIVNRAVVNMAEHEVSEAFNLLGLCQRSGIAGS